MLLLIFLFGPCIINALSIFISQQVQRIKFQFLVKEYSPLPTHEPSVQFSWGLWRLHGSTPGTSATTHTLHHSIASTKQLDVITLSPKAVVYLSQRGDLLDLET
jgi:hypothetical protein